MNDSSHSVKKVAAARFDHFGSQVLKLISRRAAEGSPHGDLDAQAARKVSVLAESFVTAPRVTEAQAIEFANVIVKAGSQPPSGYMAFFAILTGWNFPVNNHATRTIEGLERALAA